MTTKKLQVIVFVSLRASIGGAYFFVMGRGQNHLVNGGGKGDFFFCIEGARKNVLASGMYLNAFNFLVFSTLQIILRLGRNFIKSPFVL